MDRRSSMSELARTSAAKLLERDQARRIAVTSFCGKPKRKDMRILFCAAHLVLNTLVDEFGALVEW